MMFIGSISQELPVSDFTHAVYTDGKSFFIHEAGQPNALITGFVLIAIPEERVILGGDWPRSVEVGNPAIFCYTKVSTDDISELIVGTLDEMNELLPPLLNDPELDVEARLIISSFLNLHGLTANLLEKCQDEFDSNTVGINLKKQDFIKTKELQNPEASIYSDIFDRLMKSFSSQWVKPEDIVLLDNENVYFGNSRCSMLNFLENKLPAYSEKINQLLSFSINNSRIQLRMALKNDEQGKRLYSALLLSRSTEVEQVRYDELVSSKAAESSKAGNVSVLEVGFEMERRIGEMRVKGSLRSIKTITKDLKTGLKNFVQQIKEQYVTSEPI